MEQTLEFLDAELDRTEREANAEVTVRFGTKRMRNGNFGAETDDHQRDFNRTIRGIVHMLAASQDDFGAAYIAESVAAIVAGQPMRTRWDASLETLNAMLGG
jgi:hypothetical protein